MSVPPGHERRRAPRVSVAGEGPQLALPVSTAVQLLDISQSGVLLSAGQRLPVGRRAQLRTRIGVEPLTALVEVRRVASSPRTNRSEAIRLGAEFVELDAENRKKIEQFLRTEP